MPAEVVGFLREDATYGEKQALKLLRLNLPKEFTVYVETPLHNKRDIRYPDFIVLTNYGVIVLEVKDWVTIKFADPSGAIIRTREGKERHEPNPVGKAREFALVLSGELNKRLQRDSNQQSIPWSYAAILVNLPYPVITQLRNPWGEEFVWGEDDLIVPNLLQKRLKMVFPAERMRSLSKTEQDMIRAVIYPVVEIIQSGQPAFVLDTLQEKIVAEPLRVEPGAVSSKARKEEAAKRQENFFESIQPSDQSFELELPEEGQKFSQNTSIRLLRGIAGSGKSLVLIQRAKFLAAQYPEWKIGVFTYNKQLQHHLEQQLLGTNIKPRTFHGECQSLVHLQGEPAILDDWLEYNGLDYPIIRNFGIEFTGEEINWIRDLGITEKADYLSLERKGRGKIRPTPDQRKELFDLYQAYLASLAEKSAWDFPLLPFKVLDGLETGKYPKGQYDAILIDEAQDWAPIWFKIINQLLNPDHGLLFLADDPSQSIYRYFSWRDKGVHVVGRTRWLQVPYRNTYEIYRAAYSMIANDEEIQKSLSDQGELIQPVIDSNRMRHGEPPLIRKFKSHELEIDFIRQKINALRLKKIVDDQIAILCRHKAHANNLQKELGKIGVRIQPMHGFKGLETNVVFIPNLQNTFNNPDPEQEPMERRLLYMAMSRARQELYMTFSGKLPSAFNELRRQKLIDYFE
jgi:hypothetical protein